MPTHFDVVIVGGGIHGVGVAQAAAAQNYRVLLLEKQALAAGTSSRSSKLIHGGLRYLETAQFGLVHECLKERSLLLRLAPDLVRLRPFHVPIYRQTKRRPWQLRLGLGLYAALGGMQRATRFQTVPRHHWDQLDGLSTDQLQVVFRYQDGQTDDVALTKAVMRSAQSLGVQLAMPGRFMGAKLGDRSSLIEYECGDRQERCEATVLVNAAGPWVCQIAEKIRPRVVIDPIEWVQGTHIVLPAQPHKGNYYVDSPSDGRAVFVMPWKDQMLVGTTETGYRGDPDQVCPLVEEQQYLLSVLRHYFPCYSAFTIHDITAAFAGLRVLPAAAGSALHRSRQTMLQMDRPRCPRVVSILGGKLTTYRLTAQKVMRCLQASLPKRRSVAKTARLPLSLE